MTDLTSTHTAREESAVISGVRGKKVFVVDNAGNQITQFSSATVTLTNADIQIGSVEVKDATSDARAAVQSGATINYQVIGFEPLSVYQNTSLASGYNFYGFSVPGSNPTTATFKVLRETINTGEVLFANGVPTFISRWSSSSLASISWS